MPLAALRRARLPSFRREHLGVPLETRSTSPREAGMPGIPSNSGPSGSGPKEWQSLWGRDSACRLCRSPCSRSAPSKRRFCTTRRLSYTERRPSGNSSRKHSVSKKKPRGVDGKDTRSNSGIRDIRTGQRSKRMQNLNSLRPTGFGTKPQTGKCTTTTKERIIRCCRHGSRSINELFLSAVNQAWSLPPGATSREPAKGPDADVSQSAELRESCQVAAGQQGRGIREQRPSQSPGSQQEKEEGRGRGLV